MGYISLPSNLNAIIGITSYCVNLKMVISHDAMENVIFAFFIKKEKKLFSKNKKNSDLRKTKNRLFLKKQFFSTLIVFQFLL